MNWQNDYRQCMELMKTLEGRKVIYDWLIDNEWLIQRVAHRAYFNFRYRMLLKKLHGEFQDEKV